MLGCLVGWKRLVGMNTSGWDERLRTATILAEVAKGRKWV